MSKNKVKLKQGEAEELVKEIRAHLRAAQTHALQSDTRAEAKELRAFNESFNRLLDGIKGTLQKYAACCCPSNLVEDLVQEMGIGIWKEVQNLEETPHSNFYEENFTHALKRCLHNVVKTFRSDKACNSDSLTRAALKQDKERSEVEEGKREGRCDAHDVQAPLSLNAPVGDDETGEEQIESIGDKENIHAMDNVLTKEIRQEFLAELPRCDAIFVEALFRSYSVEEAAAKAGIPTRTAFDHRKKLYKRLCELCGITMKSGGVVDESASEFAKPRAKTKARTKQSASRAH